MLLRIAVVIVAMVAFVLIFAVTKPDTFRIQRSIVIQASPEKIFALLNDFHNWSQWQPQDKVDATLKRTFSGAASGEGAISDWTGTGSTGQGHMAISKSEPFRNITVVVDWAKPFRAHNVNEFSLESRGDATQVTWTMQGTNVYLTKLMSVFMNMDRFMGKHFETGLASLKVAAEKQ